MFDISTTQGGIHPGGAGSLDIALLQLLKNQSILLLMSIILSF